MVEEAVFRVAARLIDMLSHRNLLSHTYDERVLDEAIQSIVQRYIHATNELHTWFLLQIPR